VENISVPAAETQNPRYNIPKAAKRVFWRIAIFYVITIFFVGLIVSSSDKALTAHSGDAGASPFAIAAKNAGIKYVPSIINAVVVTSAWSAGNSGKGKPSGARNTRIDRLTSKQPCLWPPGPCMASLWKATRLRY